MTFNVKYVIIWHLKRKRDNMESSSFVDCNKLGIHEVNDGDIVREKKTGYILKVISSIEPHRNQKEVIAVSLDNNLCYHFDFKNIELVRGTI